MKFLLRIPAISLSTLPFLAPALNLSAQEDPNLLVYEGFDYEVNETLEFRDGGIGWNGGWTWRVAIDGKEGPIVTDSAIIEEGSLSYGNLKTSGNRVHFYGDFGKLTMARRLAEVIPGDDGDRTYISLLAQRVGPPADPDIADPYWDNPDTPEREPYPFGDNLYPQAAAPLRLFNTISHGDKLTLGNRHQQLTDTWMVYGGGLLNKTGVSFSADVAFVVVRIDHHGNDRAAEEDHLKTPDDIRVWINPDLSQGENLATADVVVIAARDVNDDRNAWDASDIAWISPIVDAAVLDDIPHAELLMDELRIGTTWESVTPTEAGSGPAMWGPYEILAGDNVDTGPWMQWLHVGNPPWVWSYALGRWAYLPETHLQASGAWIYLPK